MEEHVKSLVLRYNLFLNSTLKLLDTAIERDYLWKLKIIDDLTYKINKSTTEKKTLMNQLEAVQNECLELTYKLKMSNRLLNEVCVEKKKLEVEIEVLNSQLKQLYSIFKKPGTTDKPSICHSHYNNSNCVHNGEETQGTL